MASQMDKSADLSALIARSSQFLFISNEPLSFALSARRRSAAPRFRFSRRRSSCAQVWQSGADGRSSEPVKSTTHKTQPKEQPDATGTEGEAEMKGGICQ